MQIIQLEFLTFRTENAHDVVSVYDGVNTSAPLLGRLSGSSVPGDIFSDNSLFVYFRTDSSATYSGFEIKYTALSGELDIYLQIYVRPV